MQRAVAWP